MELENRLDIPHHLPHLTPATASEAVVTSRQNLKAIQKEAHTHHHEFLRAQAQDAADDQNISLEKAIRNINSKEQSCKHYQHIKRDLLDTTQSSITHILIPADGRLPQQSEKWKEIRAADSLNTLKNITAWHKILHLVKVIELHI